MVLLAGLGVAFVGLMLISGGDRFGAEVAAGGMALVAVGGFLVFLAVRPWYCQSCGQRVGRGDRPSRCGRCGSNRIQTNDPFSSEE